MNYFNLIGKKIKVVSNEGDVVKGKVDHVTGKFDTDSGEYDIVTMIPDEGDLKNRYVSFNETEVQSIEILD